MKLTEALPLAESIKAELAPFCSRIEIAGSIRRKCAEVGDIEIVCIVSKHVDFWQQVNRYHKIKGSTGAKYTQRVYWLTDDHTISNEGFFHEKTAQWITIDIFIATKDNWGLIYAIRTGSAKYSHNVLAAGWVKKGFNSKEGILYCKSKENPNTLQPYCVREEQELFDLIGIPYCEPEKRNV